MMLMGIVFDSRQELMPTHWLCRKWHQHTCRRGQCFTHFVRHIQHHCISGIVFSFLFLHDSICSGQGSMGCVVSKPILQNFGEHWCN